MKHGPPYGKQTVGVHPAIGGKQKGTGAAYGNHDGAEKYAEQKGLSGKPGQF